MPLASWTSVHAITSRALRCAQCLPNEPPAKKVFLFLAGRPRLAGGDFAGDGGLSHQPDRDGLSSNDSDPRKIARSTRRGRRFDGRRAATAAAAPTASATSGTISTAA